MEFKTSRRDILKAAIALGAEIFVLTNPTIAKADDKIILPKVGCVGLGDKILPGGNFSWAEATKNGTRIPDSEEIVDEIINAAKFMQEIRSYLGDKPISVTSWYRDPVSNRNVGGVYNSQHLKGRAVDFAVRGIDSGSVYDTLDEYWGDRGGLGKYSSFTHIDSRGLKVRW